MGTELVDRLAESPALAWGIALSALVEIGVAHLALHGSHPAFAWCLTAVGLVTLASILGRVVRRGAAQRARARER
jgi:hypothetical protein